LTRNERFPLIFLGIWKIFNGTTVKKTCGQTEMSKIPCLNLKPMSFPDYFSNKENVPEIIGTDLWPLEGVFSLTSITWSYPFFRRRKKNLRNASSKSRSF